VAEHLAATWDGTTLRFYVDGVQTASKAFAGDAGTTDRWRIGDFSLWTSRSASSTG
jgi:hypothetical protein